MEFKFDERHEALIADVAKEYGTAPEKVKELYCEIMYNNFYDDLADIARENADYLKGKEEDEEV